MRCFLGCFRLLLLASFLCLVMGVPAQANVTITASDVDLAPGGTGTMDFTITSDPGGTLDTLSDFGLELLITPAPTSTSLLQFTTAQSNPYGNPNYVFAGESFGSDLDLAFWSKPSKTNYPADTIYGGDLDDGLTLGYVTIPSLPEDSTRIWPQCNSRRRKERMWGISFRFRWSTIPTTRISMTRTATPSTTPPPSPVDWSRSFQNLPPSQFFLAWLFCGR